MSNEALLVLSILVIYGSGILFFKVFGKNGLYCFTVIATIAANIEVLITIKSFGMVMTLGNVLFASTYLITDITSELFGKKEAKNVVNIGIASMIIFMVFSQWWLLYAPARDDWAMPAMNTIFSNTPRLILASVVVYAIAQKFDVWAYHKWWNFTEKRFGDKERFLWLRNNGSTLLSQLLNAILYTFAAFWGIYDMKTLISIIISSYIIFIVTSLADTPFVYLARAIQKNRKQ